jgi:hypothetical protein
LHGFTPRQVETVLNEIATKANTLGEFLRQTRERTLNTEGACALYEAIDMAAMLADMLGLLADTPTGGAVRGDAAAWIIGSNFANEEKAVSA